MASKVIKRQQALSATLIADSNLGITSHKMAQLWDLCEEILNSEITVRDHSEGGKVGAYLIATGSVVSGVIGEGIAGAPIVYTGSKWYSN